MPDYKENKKLNYQNMLYSIQRIDLLIISISGAGVYLCLETMKFCYTSKLPISVSLKLASGFFIIAILFNFVSQFSGYEANKHEYLIGEILDCEKPTDTDTKDAIIHETKSKLFTAATVFFNYGSSVLMMIGLFICFYYFAITF